MAAALLVLIGAPAAAVAYLLGAEWLLARLPERGRRAVRPWVWTGPALVLVGVFLVYPTLHTLWLSFRDATGDRWVGLANYRYAFQDPAAVTAYRNNILWLVLFTAAATGLGLAIAVLADRVRYETTVKSIVFLPMALSFVAAGVIWKFMYAFRPPGAPQTGTLNAVLGVLLPHFQPRAWLVNPPENTLFLIAAGVWVWTGFCAVVLSAALKAVPVEFVEAARVDGASEPRIFRQVVLPLVGPTVAVVATTMVVTALKVFDIVYVMTSGSFGTEVVANRMYKELFTFQHAGRAGALAMLLLAATLPFMIAAARRLQAGQEPS